MPAADDDKRRAARETIDILHEISTLLNTNLDRHTLSYCVSLIENGVNPEALAVRLPIEFLFDRQANAVEQNVIIELRAKSERFAAEAEKARLEGR